MCSEPDSDMQTTTFKAYDNRHIFNNYFQIPISIQVQCITSKLRQESGTAETAVNTIDQLCILTIQLTTVHTDKQTR